MAGRDLRKNSIKILVTVLACIAVVTFNYFKDEPETLRINIDSDGYNIEGAPKRLSELAAIAQSYIGGRLEVCIEHGAPNALLKELTQYLDMASFRAKGFVSAKNCG